MNGPPDTTAGVQMHIAHGQVAGHQGTRFAGITCARATGSRPAHVRIAVRHGTRELTAELHEDDTLMLPGQTWRLDAIHATRSRWHAILTRIT